MELPDSTFQPWYLGTLQFNNRYVSLQLNPLNFIHKKFTSSKIYPQEVYATVSTKISFSKLTRFTVVITPIYYLAISSPQAKHWNICHTIATR